LANYLNIAPNLETKITLDQSPNLSMVALIFTYMIFIIEAIVLSAFAIKQSSFFRNIKDYALQLFIITLYSLIPVIGFGFILCILGLAQLDSGEKKKFGLYFFALLIIQLATHFSVLDLVTTSYTI